jgi:hypothetical protein
MTGFSLSVSQFTASIMQASLQKPQPLHLLGFSFTPPSLLGINAPVGQTLAQGGLMHEQQTTTIKPVSIPPFDFIIMLELVRPAFPFLREQANMQLWHPTHLSESIIDNFIGSLSKFMQLNKILITKIYNKHTEKQG